MKRYKKGDKIRVWAAAENKYYPAVVLADDGRDVTIRYTGKLPVGQRRQGDILRDIIKEEAELTEKAPPGWAGTVKAMKKHMPDERAFALAWSMYKKGAEPHYKALPSTKSDKEPELKKKYKKAGGVAEQLQSALAEGINLAGAVPANAVKVIQQVLKGGSPDKDALANIVHKKTWKQKDSKGKRLGITALGAMNVIRELEKQGKVSIKDDKVHLEWDDLEESVSLPAEVLAVADYVAGKKGKVSAAELMRRFRMTRTWAKKILAVAKRAFRGAGIPRGEMLRARSDPARYFREKVLPVLEKWPGPKSMAPATAEDLEDTMGMDALFEAAIEEELLAEKGSHYYDGKNYYVDTAFLNAIGDTMKGMSLDHMGFGEFSLKGNGKSVEFDRMRGKKFKGQSGRSHQVYDNKKGALVKELIKQMEKKGRSELVREAVEDDDGLLFEVFDLSEMSPERAAWLGISVAEPKESPVGALAKKMRALVAKIKNPLYKMSAEDLKGTLAKHGVKAMVWKKDDRYVLHVPKRQATKAKNILSTLHKYMGVKEEVELSEAGEIKKAQDYAREVAAEIARLRGWSGKVPKKVTDDIFATLERHRSVYTAFFSGGTPPKKAAKAIQNREWMKREETELSEQEWTDALRLVRMVTEGLPQLRKKYFFARFGPQYVVPQVYVQYADVPKGTKTSKAVDCDKQVMLKVQPFTKKGDAKGPLEVKVHYSKRKDIGFKPKKGSVEEIAKHIVGFLKKHDAKEVKGGHMKLAASMADQLDAALWESPINEDWTDTSVLAWPEEAPEPEITESGGGSDMDELFERAAVKAQALSPEDFRSDNQMLIRELQRSVDQTRRFVRSIYHMEEVALELAHAAKETERIRRTAGVERAMRRSPINNATRSFAAQASSLYGSFAEGRNAMMAVAKMARIPTRRTAKRRPVPKVTGEITASNLVRNVNQIAAKMGASIREAGELGSVAIREAEKLLNQKSVIGGDKLAERIGAIVQIYLDFRDQVSEGLFKMIASVVRRMNEISKRLMAMYEEEQDIPVLTLPWAEDPDFEGVDDEIVVISDDGGYSQGNGWLEAVA
jgi:hypothetical protein